MRKVRIVENLDQRKFELQYKEVWYKAWQHFTTTCYKTTGEGPSYWPTRDEALARLKLLAHSLETEKVVYETPQKVYYG